MAKHFSFLLYDFDYLIHVVDEAQSNVRLFNVSLGLS
jgi:hypothetical protein